MRVYTKNNNALRNCVSITTSRNQLALGQLSRTSTPKTVGHGAAISQVLEISIPSYGKSTCERFVLFRKARLEPQRSVQRHDCDLRSRSKSQTSELEQRFRLEIMVWNDYDNSHGWASSGRPQVTIDGVRYYKGSERRSDGTLVYTYARVNRSTSSSIDAMKFIRDSGLDTRRNAQGQIIPTWLSSNTAGYELYRGSGSSRPRTQFSVS